MSERRRAGARIVPAVWAAAAAALVLLFLRDHPSRPIFSPPTGGASVSFPGTDHGAALLGLAGAGAAALLAGAGIARLLRLDRPSGTTAAGLGFAWASLLSFVLLAAGLFRPVLLAPLLLLPAAAIRPDSLPRIGIPRPGRSPDRWALAALAGLAFATASLLALAPLTANDPMVYHMTLARAYAEGGGFGAAPDLIYARMPHGGDLLFAAAYRLGGEPAARALFPLLLGLNALVAARIARRVRPGTSGAGAAVLLLSAPLVLDPRTVGNVDLIASLHFGLAALHILRRRAGGGAGETAAAALLAGSMLAVKYSAYAAYPVLAALFLLPFRSGARPPSGRDLLLFAGLSHLLLLPWPVKAWLETGNPLFPMFPALLGGAGWSAELGGRLIAWQRSIGMGRGAADWFLLPWNIVMRGGPAYRFFDGVLTPAFLLWAPWAAVRGGRTARLLLAAALGGILLWGTGSQQLRFLLPVLLLLAGVIGAHRRTERGGAGTAQAVLFALLALLLLLPSARRAVRDTLPVVLGRESREAYLARKVQAYPAFREAGRIIPPGEKTLLVWENRGYYFPRPYGADSFFEASRIAAGAAAAGSPESWLAGLRREGYRWALVNRPLQRVFARWSPPRGIAVMDGAWARCDRAGAWNGLELYRLPGEGRVGPD